VHAFLKHSPILIVVVWDHLYLTSPFVSPRYSYFVLLQNGVILEIPRLLKIWRAHKSDNTMYKKNCFKIGPPPISKIVLNTWIALRTTHLLLKERFEKNMILVL
jgi:hypothetical protein